MILTIDRMMSHLLDLARAFNVRLLQDSAMPPESAVAVPKDRVVLMGPVREQTGYAVCLHEMGHLVAANGLAAGVVGEDAAWEWAQHMALDWTPTMQQVRDWAFGTYLAAREQDVRLPFTPAAPTAPTGPAQQVGDAASFARKIRWQS